MRCLDPQEAWLPTVKLRQFLDKIEAQFGKEYAVAAAHGRGKQPIFVRSCPSMPRMFDGVYRDDLWTKGYLPCGKCRACLMARRSDWVARNVLEYADHDEACFLTLTYDDDHLVKLPLVRGYRSLNPDHLSAFMKRLRFFLQPKKVRFFGCGEYGSKFSRPHFHVLLYGHKFEDFVYDKDRSSLYSASLRDLWPNGFSSVGDVTEASIAYVCSYVAKKFGVKYPKGLSPPFVRMSLRPGIGFKWFSCFSSQVLRFDSHGDVVRWSLPDNVPVPLAFQRRYQDLYPDRAEKRRKVVEEFFKSHDCEIDWQEVNARSAFLDCLARSASNRSYEG